jgi:hypothetical protein
MLLEKVLLERRLGIQLVPSESLPLGFVSEEFRLVI